MANYRQTLVVKWTDQNGGTRTQTISTQDNPAPSFGAAGALMTAVQAASDCGLWLAKICPVSVVNEAAADGPYKTVQDVALMIFRTSADTTIRITVPGPKAAMFKADLKTVDPAAALTAAIIAAVLGAVSDANGNPATTYVSGSRQKQEVPPVVGP